MGQSVLVFYKMDDGGEWCRGTVETVKRSGATTVHFTDYGHGTSRRWTGEELRIQGEDDACPGHRGSFL